MNLIDPSIVAGLGFLFNKTVTIQANTPTQDGTGAEVDVWADLADHVALPCVKMPARPVAPMPDERKEPRQTVVVQLWKIILQGCYPAITNEMRAVVDGQVYDIVGAQSDSQDLITSLLVQRVT